MPGSLLTDDETEELLSGAVPEGRDELAGLATAFESLRAGARREPVPPMSRALRAQMYQHRVTVGPSPGRRAAIWATAAAFAALALLAAGATQNALPDGVQDAVSSTADRIGIDIPRSEESDRGVDDPGTPAEQREDDGDGAERSREGQGDSRGSGQQGPSNGATPAEPGGPGEPATPATPPDHSQGKMPRDGGTGAPGAEGPQGTVPARGKADDPGGHAPGLDPATEVDPLSGSGEHGAGPDTGNDGDGRGPPDHAGEQGEKASGNPNAGP